MEKLKLQDVYTVLALVGKKLGWSSTYILRVTNAFIVIALDINDKTSP